MKRIQFDVQNDNEAEFYAELIHNQLAIYRVFRAPKEPLVVTVVDVQPEETQS